MFKGLVFLMGQTPTWGCQIGYVSPILILKMLNFVILVSVIGVSGIMLVIKRELWYLFVFIMFIFTICKLHMDLSVSAFVFLIY